MASYTLKEVVEGKWRNQTSARFKKAAQRGLLSAGYAMVQRIVTDLIPRVDRPPVDRGIYRAGWRVVQTPEGAVHVYNPTPHANFIEFGVRPERVKIGKKMIDALSRWARRVGLGSTTVKTKSGGTRLKKATMTESQSIAWAIAKNMQKAGIFNSGGLVSGLTGLRVLKRAVMDSEKDKLVQKHISAELTAEFGAGNKLGGGKP